MSFLLCKNKSRICLKIFLQNVETVTLGCYHFFFLFFLPNKCYERISPGIHSTLRVKNMYMMETGRVLKLADSSALLKLLETFKGSRDEGVVFFGENQVTEKCPSLQNN